MISAELNFNDLITLTAEITRNTWLVAAPVGAVVGVIVGGFFGFVFGRSCPVQHAPPSHS